MLRPVGKKIKVNRFVEIEETVTNEMITTVHMDINAKIMYMIVDLINDKNEVVESQKKMVTGTDYDLLFSGDSFFEEGKQEGSYREVDLWKMIDLVSAK